MKVAIWTQLFKFQNLLGNFKVRHTNSAISTTDQYSLGKSVTTAKVSRATWKADHWNSTNKLLNNHFSALFNRWIDLERKFSFEKIDELLLKETSWSSCDREGGQFQVLRIQTLSICKGIGTCLLLFRKFTKVSYEPPALLIWKKKNSGWVVK